MKFDLWYGVSLKSNISIFPNLVSILTLFSLFFWLYSKKNGIAFLSSKTNWSATDLTSIFFSTLGWFIIVLFTVFTGGLSQENRIIKKQNDKFDIWNFLNLNIDY